MTENERRDVNVTYRAVSNYLANELGVDREFVAEMLDKKIDQRNPGQLVKEAVAAYLGVGHDAVNADYVAQTHLRDLVAAEVRAAMTDEMRAKLAAVVDAEIDRMTGARTWSTHQADVVRALVHKLNETTGASGDAPSDAIIDEAGLSERDLRELFPDRVTTSVNKTAPVPRTLHERLRAHVGDHLVVVSESNGVPGGERRVVRVGDSRGEVLVTELDAPDLADDDVHAVDLRLVPNRHLGAPDVDLFATPAGRSILRVNVRDVSRATGVRRDPAPISLFTPGSRERRRLEVVAEMLSTFSGLETRVEDTYFDRGQDWKWTTVVGRRRDEDDGLEFQVLHAGQQERVLTGSMADLHAVVQDLVLKYPRD